MLPATPPCPSFPGPEPAQGDAELGERLVVIFPFTNPWSLKFMEMLAYLLLQLYQEKCPEPC